VIVIVTSLVVVVDVVVVDAEVPVVVDVEVPVVVAVEVVNVEKPVVKANVKFKKPVVDFAISLL
jgi:hypothetical protein